MNRMRIFIAKRPGTLRVALMLAFMVAVGYQRGFCCRDGNQPAVGRSADNACDITDRAGGIRHFGHRNRGARSHACVSWRGDGRDDAASPSGWHRGLLGRFCGSGHDFVHRPERGDCHAPTGTCDCSGVDNNRRFTGGSLNTQASSLPFGVSHGRTRADDHADIVEQAATASRWR